MPLASSGATTHEHDGGPRLSRSCRDGCAPGTDPGLVTEPVWDEPLTLTTRSEGAMTGRVDGTARTWHRTCHRPAYRSGMTIGKSGVGADHDGARTALVAMLA